MIGGISFENEEWKDENFGISEKVSDKERGKNSGKCVSLFYISHFLQRFKYEILYEHVDLMSLQIPLRQC